MSSIAWESVSLPLFTYQGLSLKDPALIHVDGVFYLACSVFDAKNHSKLGLWRSHNLATWEGPLWLRGDGADGWCSPDIVPHGDGWLMTFQSWDAIPPRESRNQLFYALSDDGATWSDPQPLAANLTAGVRAIDAAVAHHGDDWYLLYKEAQTPRLATAPALTGPWSQLDNPLSCWAENGQFVSIDGRWHLVATLLDHEQGIATQQGQPTDPSAWTDWADFQRLDTPVRLGFNESSPANASALWDGRDVDGYWYRVYCAANRPTNTNWGYQLGVARSRDLVSWQLPGDYDPGVGA